MLKETETEETIVFFVTFLSLVAFKNKGGGGGALATPMSSRSFSELQQVYYICKECSSPSLGKPGIVSDKIIKFRLKCIKHLIAFHQSNLIMVLQ